MPRRHAWPLLGVTTLPPTPPQVAALTRAVFNGGARYLGDESEWCGPGVAQRVPWVEVAVLGRSNVGKSSLLNAMLGSKKHAFVPVSRHPGSTMHIDFYGVGVTTGGGRGGNGAAPPPPLALVDTPGYGYSRRGHAAGDAWMDLLQTYLRSRTPATLVRVCVLVDGRHGLTALDHAVLSALDGAAMPYTVVLTKADALTDVQLEVAAANVAAALARRAALHPILHAVSAHTGAGVPDLLHNLVRAAKWHTATPTPPPPPTPA